MSGLNIWHVCKKCDQHCCKKGHPMVLPHEKDIIVERTGKDGYFENHGDFFILKGNPCPFFEKTGKCSIHKIKPLDCLTYPIFIKPISETEREWYLDPDCPAGNHLTLEFITMAKKKILALPREYQIYDWKIVNYVAGFKTKKLK